MDLSSFKYYNFGDVFNSYVPSSPNLKSHREEGNDAFRLTIEQSRDIQRRKAVTKAFNNVMGQIGGYTSLIWMVITFMMSDYENHKFRNSLLSNIYLCTEDGPNAPPCDSEEQS